MILRRLVDYIRIAWEYVLDAFKRAGCVIHDALRDGLSARQRNQLRLIVALTVIVIVLSALMVWIIALVTSDPDGFKSFLDTNAVLATVIFALVNTLQVIVGVIPGEPLEILAGYLWGTWGGCLVVSVGLALGELLVFVAVKRYGMKLVRHFVSEQKLAELSWFNDPKRLNIITFLMMFIPGTPKDITVYMVGLSPMTLGTWMLIAIPARIFSIVSSTLVGDQMAQSNWLVAALLFAVVMLISAGGILYYLLISRQARQAALLDEIGRREWHESGCRRNDA